MKSVKIKNLYQKFCKKYGRLDKHWRLWCKRSKTFKEREEVVIGAILAQRTNWKNVEKAIIYLKKNNKCSLLSIYYLYLDNRKKLISLIKPSGFYNQKTDYLFGLTKFIFKDCGGLRRMKKMNLVKLREELLKLKGLGPETADTILLYGLGKPIFVIDEYTRRFVKKYKLIKEPSHHNKGGQNKTLIKLNFYSYLQCLFQENLPKDVKIYQDFHAMIVLDGKNKNLTSPR